MFFFHNFHVNITCKNLLHNLNYHSMVEILSKVSINIKVTWSQIFISKRVLTFTRLKICQFMFFGSYILNNSSISIFLYLLLSLLRWNLRVSKTFQRQFNSFHKRFFILFSFSYQFHPKNVNFWYIGTSVTNVMAPESKMNILNR